MADLNPEVLDLQQVLSGIGFPEEVVDVYFDESVGYEIYKAEKALRLAEIKGNEETLKSVAENLENLKKQAAGTAFKVTVRGVPESTRKACDKKARDKYPVEYSFMGQPEPSAERDDYYNSLLWAASIVKLEDPSGKVGIPGEEFILSLREKAGRTVIAAISGAIDELVSGAKSGFESSAQDIDFLSDASPEE